MDNRRFGWSALLAVVISLGGAPACDDSGSDPESTDNTGGNTGGNTDNGGGNTDNGGGNTDDDDEPGTTEPKNIVETAVAAGSFNTLAEALVRTGLDEALAGEGPFTVFAPTDEAFAKLPEGTLESLTDEQLADILQYHVVSGDVRSTDLTAAPVKMLNGISAFIKLDDGVTINDATVTTADVEASNGVIHVIDTVILPPNLAQAAQLAGGFDTLLGAVTQVGLDGALTGEGPLTVFAPTDAAFGALPEGTLESLTDEQLSGILQYHVVAGEVLSTDLSNGEVEMLSGGKITVNVDEGVKVNDSNVVLADIVTTNGVIHVIDAVLLPE